MNLNLFRLAFIIIFLIYTPRSFAQSLIQDKLVERLARYAAINTQSDYDSQTIPSTPAQKEFAKMLAAELKQAGLDNVFIDGNSYVHAELPATVKDAPIIFISAHMDTTPDEDLYGKNPKPVIHNYKGGNLKISDEYTLAPEEEPYLASAAGGKIVTSDGATILGADDKAGIAIAITLAEKFIKDKKARHGKIKFIFTTDEEVGNGTKFLSKELIGADYGIVLDGRGFGRLVTQNFNAADFKIEIKAPPAGHPGAQTLPSAMFIKDDILALFPQDLRPYSTKDTQGYASYYKAEDKGNTAIIHGRIREHDKAAFESLKDMVKNLTAYYNSYLNGKYKGAHGFTITLKMSDSYYNSKEILEKFPHNFNILMAAYKKAGIAPKLEAARGGSDANEITYMGIPSYNLFAGYHNDHSPKEWASSIQMEAALNVVWHYITGWAQETPEEQLKSSLKDSLKDGSLQNIKQKFK